MITNKQICWSRFPQADYSVEFEGEMVGMGLHPALVAVPGAWNILVMLATDLVESLTPWQKEPGLMPWSCGYLPYAVGSALQGFDDQMTVGDLASISTPTQFLALLKVAPRKDGIIMVDAFEDLFWERAEAFAEGWAPPLANNVVRGNFGQKARLQ